MNLTDEQLMIESAEGSNVAFECLIRRWDTRLFNFFLRCVGNRGEAEDLRQELFLRIYRHRKSFKYDGHFQTWIYRIATNLFIDRHVRKRKPMMTTLDECDEACFATQGNSDNDPASHTSWVEMKDRLSHALKQVPDDKRVVLVLHHFENMTCREIADALQLPQHTVKNRLYRGLDIMRQELKRVGIFDAAMIPSG